MNPVAKWLLIILSVLGMLFFVITLASPSKPAAQTQPAANAPSRASPQAGKAESAPPALPGLGMPVDTGTFGFTAIESVRANVLGKIPRQAQGIFVIITMRIENRSNQSQPINSWDFRGHDAVGRTYTLSSEGSTALLGTEPEPFWLNATVQPGLSKTVRLVFDIMPQPRGLQLEVQGGKRIVVE